MRKFLKALLPACLVFAISSCTFDTIDVPPPHDPNHHHVACGDTTHLPTTKIVIVKNYEFMPDTVSISSGDTVRFVWQSGADVHTTTSTAVPSGASNWDKPMDATNCIYEHKFTTTGTYSYKCTPHFPAMVGTIIVQ